MERRLTADIAAAATRALPHIRSLPRRGQIEPVLIVIRDSANDKPQQVVGLP